LLNALAALDLDKLGKGVKPGLSRSEAYDQIMALPPLAEQHRIVAKVDELMGLCDRLEAARASREAVRDRLAAASLARLNAPDPETFHADACFALDALPALTTRPDQIKQLRQTILNLAVRGKLVPQDLSDEPASELLKRIAKEKARLVKAGAIPAKKEPVRDPTKLTEELPAPWCPVALGQVCNMVTSGSRGWAEFYATSGPGFIRAQNIRFGKLRLDDLAFVNPPANSEGSRTQVAKGDLLIVITGAGVTNPALLDRDPGEAYVSQHVGLVRPSDQRLSEWLLLCLMADAGGRAELVERAYGAGKPGLNLDNIRSLSIPLPPLAEQRRIVAEVDALMALCDRLEASLNLTAAVRRRLLDALLAEALTPAEDRELEAAE
jgi:type I restriction enzyme S subunit